MTRIPRRACQQSANISKKTVIASFEEGTTTRNYLESLNDDNWGISSFDPDRRQVCIFVLATKGNFIHNLSLNLPVYS